MLNKITLKLRQLQLTFILCFLSLFNGWNVFAEGSKDLFPSGATGNRMMLSSSGIAPTSTAIVNKGRMFVYAKANETLYLGSSAQGIRGGTILLTSPTGDTSFSSGNSTTVGLITNRTQEINGPVNLTTGGYTPYSFKVPAGETGVWVVEFISPNVNLDPANVIYAAHTFTADGNWTQANNSPYVVAWDITVANEGGTAQKGRVYTNVLTGSLGSASNSFMSTCNIITNDGFRYTVKPNGMTPYYFAFFCNNKGVRTGSAATGAPSYKSTSMASLYNLDNTKTDFSFQDPTIVDDLTNTTSKIFFNLPDASLPASAPIFFPGSTASTTWLNVPIVTQAISAISVNGVEGTSGMGIYPLGAFINFTATVNANYLIEIDVNGNGLMTDAIDVTLTGTAIAGANKVRWDGRDGARNPITNNTSLKLSIVLFNGEVHFPYLDAERNTNGIIITRSNGPDPNSNVYWNDTPIGTDTGSTDKFPPNLLDASSRTLNNSSLAGTHKWTTSSSRSSGYGDLQLLDTWAYVYTTPGPPISVPIVQNEADLAVTSISDVVSGNVGSNVTYTVVVKNIGGPNNVTGAKFKFSDLASGANLAVQSFTSSSTLGGAVTAQTITGGVLDAMVDLPKDATITFTIVAKVLAAAGSNPTVKATIMRPADLTDPDATADTHIGTPPVDPDVECDGTPSGVGCNNVKTDVLTVIFIASPKIEVAKKATYVDANADGIVNAGDRIDYTFTVTNTGNVTLAPVTITDANAVVSGSLASLAPGATDSSSFTAVHTITLADMNNGQVDNVATVSGTPPTGSPVTAKSIDPSPICSTCPPKDPAACPSCTVVPLTSSPKVTVSKKGVYVDANADGIVNVGDRIDYTFTVRNTGNVTLAPVTISDANAVVSGSLASLAPGATDSSSFTAVHTITLADMNNGQVDNVATITGTPPTGPAVTAKSTDPSPICSTCPPKDPAACPSCTVVPLTSSPKVTVSKKGVYVDANADGIVNVGDRIDYTFTVRNTGNVTLAPVTISDANAVVSGSLASLAPGATDSSSFTAVHTITLADMNNGQVDNVATITGTPPTGPAVTAKSTDPSPICSTCPPKDPAACPSCTVVPLTSSPKVTVSKKATYVDANADGIVNVGDRIDYTFTVTNTGNVTLAPVTITDANAVVSGSLASLAPGATDSSSFTAVHTITLADMNNGQVDNVATVSGTPPTGSPVTAKSTDPSPICSTCPPKDPAACPSCTVVPLTSSPKVTVSKKGVYVDANADGIVNVGDRIDYTFTVTNTGNVTLAPVTITDANAVVSGSLASLAPGATDSSSFTAVHTITLADMNNGQVDNVATVTGTPPTGSPVTAKSTDPSPICSTCPPKDPAACPSCTVVPLTSSPKVTVSKKGVYVDANADGIVNAGDRIDYTFTVINTGNVTLAPVTITDANAVVSGSLASLAPGATDSSSFTAVHTITLADMNNGQVDNVATVTGTPPTGSPVTAKSTDPSPICSTCPPKDPAACPSCTVVPLTSSPKVTVSKKATYVDANADGIVNVGDRIDYTFTVTNTGNVTLAPVTITDANAVVSGSLASLAPGATDSSSFTAVHTITLADMNNGQVDNVATVSGTPPTGSPVTAKSTDPSPICSTCPPKDPAACPSCTVVPLTSSPKVTVSKKATYVDANADGIVNAGDRIDYTFTVTNTGNVTLAPVTITDANAVVSGSLASLAPGATDSSSFTAVHTITLADMNNGQVDNVATITGTPPTGPAVTAKSTDPSPICSTCPPKDPAACPSCTVVPLTSSPKVTVSKKATYVDANADGIVNVGDRIDYTFTVINTGNVTLAPVTITDANAVVSGSLASLAPGATDSSSFTAVHTITLADMNNGQVDNVATVTGTPPTGSPVTAKSTDPSPICSTCPPKDPATCPSCTVVPLTSSPKVTVSKKGVYVDANADGIVNAGDRIDYTFTVTNTGNVTLAPVIISDANAVVSGSLASLAPGATDSSSFTAVHTITLADMNNGQVDNVATVTGTPPTGSPVTAKSTDPSPICSTCPPKDPATCPSCTVVPLTSSPKVTVSKKGVYVDANADGIVNAGDRIDYTFTVTNTGNVTLAPVIISDANAVVSGSLASLAPGATDSSSFTAVHTITLADMNNGQVDNVATVTGTPPTGSPVTAKSTDPSPICSTCPPKDPAACPSCTVVPLTSSPKVTVSKKGVYVDANADGIVNVGDRIDYTFTVTNTGNVTLAPVIISDANAVVSGSLASLAPGATDSSSFTAVHTITLADMNNGQVDNVATVTGTPPTGSPVTAKSTDPSPICSTCPPKDPATCPSCTVVPLTSSPKVTVSKKGVYVDANADGIVNAGDRIDYTFTVTNTGNVTLAPVTISDANAVVSGSLASLAPGATDSSSFTAVHTITLADMNNGQVDNVATVTGTPPTGSPVTAKSTDPSPICSTCPPKDPAACPSCTVVPLTSSPKVTVSKKGVYVDANADGIVNVGDRIDYTFTVTNTGNVTLAPVTISDANAVVSGSLASLAPGATDSSSFTAVHTITLADMNNGQVDNVATVTGTPPTGSPVTAKSTDPSPICSTCRPIDPTCSTCTVVSFIDAIDEIPLVVNGLNGGTTVSVLLNDKLHGTPIVASDVNLSAVYLPTGMTLNTDGTIKVNTGTAPGGYTVIYSICSKAMAAAGTPMCDQAEAKITVTATVEPIFENGTIASTGGTVFTNIASNDKVNGVPAVLGTTGNATVAVSGTWPTGITLDPLTGKVSVAAGTTPGTYNVVYELCDKLSPVTCATVSDEIKVTPVVEPIFENGTIASTGGTVFTNIASNDKVNGVPAVLGTTGNATVAVSGTWPTGITLDPLTGKVSVAAGTTPGTYNVVYQLCDKLSSVTCATVSDEIKVTPVVEPIFENGTIASTGGTVFTNIASNDKVNGVPAVLGTTGNATVAVSGTWPTGITLDPLTGKVSVAAGTTPGTYNVVYELCDKLSPTTCATVSDEIKVTPAVEPIFENGTIASTGGTVFTNIASNDKVNGVPAVLGTTGNATVAVSGTWPTGITLDPLTGKVSVAAGTTPGTYNVVYELCDKLTPTTCATVSDEIKVTAIAGTSIIANDDNIPNVNGITGTPNAGNVLVGNPNSDTLNGVPVVISLVDLKVTTPAVPKTPGAAVPVIDTATGTISVPANTPGGTYTLTYSICEKSNLSNCDAATVTLFVSRPSIAVVKTAHFNDEDGDSNAKVGETITYNFTVTNTGNVALTNVYIVDPLTGITMTGGPINLAVGEEDNTSFTGTYSIVQADINSGSISNQAEVFGTSPDHIEVKDKSDDSSVLGDKPTVLSLQSCVIKVFNAVSINGDSKNERFYIQGLECYPDNTVQIFNRWGVLVFDRDHYNNNDIVFRGISEGRVTIKDSDGLPEGTYYYIIKYKDNQSNPHQEAGYLYLTK